MAKQAKPPPVTITTTVGPGRGGGRVPDLGSAAAHSDAAQQAARLAAAHSERASILSRTAQREAPRRKK